MDGERCFRVPLTRGHYAIIDEADSERVLAVNWIAFRSKSIQPNWYAYACVRKADGNYGSIQLHRFILGLSASDPFVDHINCNGLDNRRSNLRLASQAENLANTRKQLGCSSKYKGVCWYPKLNKWHSYISPPFIGRIHLGYFKKEEDAALAYDAAAIEVFGVFARLNFSTTT